MRLACLALFFAFGLDAIAAERVNSHKPWLEASYHGVITENSELVTLDPPLIAVDKDAPTPYAGEICGFRVLGSDVPFEAIVLNRTTGAGQLRARAPIDCERQRQHSFLIQAHDCGTGAGGLGHKNSHKAVVHVEVEDVNEFSPVFPLAEYHADITEGRVYDSILQVSASDEDCSPQYSQICSYHILNTHTPFTIDQHGNVRNTERLSVEERAQYTLQVTAFDCGQRESPHPATIHINVTPTCRPGWHGFSRHVEYGVDLGSVAIFPRVHLELCGVAISSLRVMVEQRSTHTHHTCHHQDTQRLCGPSSDIMDLLPLPSPSANWTATLVTEGGRGSDIIFRFEGRQAAKLPDWALPGNLTAQFTIATWMKHAANTGDKEIILCISHKTEMNRHHFSLYVHKCRLVFLMRMSDLHSGSFRPTHFHWKLQQVCDKEWHHYALHVAFPTVTLYVDGVTYDPYLLTDDWPAHSLVKDDWPVHSLMKDDWPIHSPAVHTQLSVGACWQGGDTGRFVQYLRGSLSGLRVLTGHTEEHSLLSCLQSCREGLDINALHNIDKNIKFHFSPSLALVVLEGEGVEGVEEAIRRVAFFSSHTHTTPGARRYRLASYIQCVGEDDDCISIPDIEAVVTVMSSGEPRISIRGAEHLASPASHLNSQSGISLFPDLNISSNLLGSGSDDLDSCDVVVEGEELKAGLESLQLQRAILLDTQLQKDTRLDSHLEYNNSTSGISISGVASMAQYVELLRAVRYINLRPEISVRHFRLTCSQLNGRYTSNTLHLEVNILHSSPAAEHVNHMKAPPTFTQVVHHPLMLQAAESPGVESVAGSVLLVCVCALVLVVVGGAYWIHATLQEANTHLDTHTHSGDLWHNPAVTITVNPMESFEEALAAVGQLSEDEEEEEEEEEEDDLTSADSDSQEEEEDEEEAELHQESRRRAQQDWDNMAPF